MTKLPWEFKNYPETGLDDIAGAVYEWSDEVLIKCTNGDIHLANYCKNKRMWYDPCTNEWIHWKEVVCWTYYGKVPESVTSMPEPERSNNG